MIVNFTKPTLNDFKLAYKKFKSTVYFDTSNTNLFLRKKIADWEYINNPSINKFDKFIDRKIKLLYNAFSNKDVTYFDKLLSTISYNILPKKIESALAKLPDNILVNKRKHTEYSINKLTFFIDAPIELHIISTLWIMKYGYRLDNKFDEYCFGNRLFLDEAKLNIVNGLNLFKPYFVQYQLWRDKGIEKAQQLLNEKKDIIFVNLDIQNFYYSARINIKELISSLNIKKTVPYGLNDLLFRIYKKYTSLLIETKYPSKELFTNFNVDDEVLLPIGLLSSNVLSNWYLNKFDSKIRKVLNPAYFSRYVDDIFIIVENPKLISDDSHLLENLFKKYFKNILIKIDKLENEDSSTYQLVDYTNLVIQEKKSLLYYFHHDESTAVIDKLKRDLDERSSEFRYLPEYEDEKLFEKEAYELVYDDSHNKIRTLKDYKENRFGLSTYLAKRIFAALRANSNNNSVDVSSLMKFFRGENLLSFYTLWEKLFTYFLVLDNQKDFQKLYKEIQTVLSSKLIYKNTALISKTRSGLQTYLQISMDLALALNPPFIKRIKDSLESPTKYKAYRLSNLIRDKYITHPLLNITNIATHKSNYPIVKYQLQISNIRQPPKFPLDINYSVCSYFPRKIKFYEATLITIWDNLSSYSVLKNPNWQNPFDLSAVSKTYLDKAFELYCKINYPGYSNQFKSQKRKEFFALTTSKQINQIVIPNGGEVLPRLKVSVANTNVKQEEIVDSMLSRHFNFKSKYTTFTTLSTQSIDAESKLMVLPENFLPHDFLSLIAKFSYQQQIAIVTGLEHWVINNIGYNFIATILPIKVDEMSDCIISLRLKNHYAPKETEILNGYRIWVPKTMPKKYDLFIWRGMYFSNYYCYELCNIKHRSLFKSKVDFIVSSEWNPDTNYFSNIVESTSRDVHCYFIQVNTPQYGDSRITCPKSSVLKDILKLKGGENHTILTGTIDITSLRNFQLKEYNLQQHDKTFKPTPPDFKRINVIKRINNKNII